MQQHDMSLVERVLAGEKAAFGPLVERHYPGALQLARRLLGEPADAADVVQEACLQAFLGLHALRDSAHFGAWLLGIVVNLCRMHLRSQREVYTWDDWSGGHHLPGLRWTDTQPSPEALYVERELHNLVLAAITTLPLAQQEAVRLYYLEGLTLREMSLLVGAPLGTVKARLHRARTLLRQALEYADTSTRTLIQGVDKEDSMVEVIVHDVMVHVAKGDEVRPEMPLQLAAYKKHGGMMVVLLQERQGQRILPIWVSLAEGNALALHLAEVATPRPMTFDFMVQLLDVSALHVDKVAITTLLDSVFYATLWVRAGAHVHEIDARPSDAINLALRMRVPIFVDPAVFARASLSPESVLPEAEAQYQFIMQTDDDPELELRSFRSLFRQ
jgi:RNA polymerase sigma factor (sigma-70 family)